MLLDQFKHKNKEMPVVSVIIGPEGGFSAEEANKAKAAGMLMAGLGPRILRTETASGFALGAISCALELS
jgi:16S rRNA (uracil1498-N3)-methyltransferase